MAVSDRILCKLHDKHKGIVTYRFFVFDIDNILTDYHLSTRTRDKRFVYEVTKR